MAKIQIAGLGGTFDHFHIGHHHFLQFAADQAQELWVGLTMDSLNTNKKWVRAIQPYQKRYEQLNSALQTLNHPFRIFPLENGFGPTLQNSPVDGLIVTDHSLKGGEMINQKRLQLGLNGLPIKVSNLLRDENDSIISSTRIRSGEIQRSGKSWISQQLFQPLTAKAREALHQPFGEIVNAPNQDSIMTIVVGDICATNFVKNQWHADLLVIDQHTQRHLISQPFPLNPTDELAHPPGQLASQTLRWLRTFFDSESTKNQPEVLLIEGEEDLIAVEAILTAPLNSKLYYGQPNVGMMEVLITEELKLQLLNLFQ